MTPKETPERQLQNSVATEINFLRLPIFKATKLPVADKIIIIDETIDNNRYHIEISHGGILGGFDRKVLLVMEALYLQQNPDFQSNKVVTNFVEVARIMGLHPNTASQIWKSLSKLNDVQIKAEITVKNGQKLLDINSQFNLLASVTKVLARKVKGTQRKTETVEVELNRWHIDNFRNRYYRVVNLRLVTQLQSSIAVRLFDYLNYRAFYFDKKARKYRQKLKIRVSYQDMVKYLHVAQRPNLTEIKKQFRTALNELKLKGVLRRFEYDKTPLGVYLVLYLSRSINWREVEPGEIHKIPAIESKKTEMEARLEEAGLSRSQVHNIFAEYPKKYVKLKLDQLKYLLNFASHKVKGEGSYLYQSIVNDWRDDSYEAHLREEKAAEKSVTKRAIEKIDRQYDEYVRDSCAEYYQSLPVAEREIIEDQIKKDPEIETFEEKAPGTLAFMVEAKKAEILRERVDLMTFQEFCEHQKPDADQLLLFEEVGRGEEIFDIDNV